MNRPATTRFDAIRVEERRTTLQKDYDASVARLRRAVRPFLLTALIPAPLWLAGPSGGWIALLVLVHARNDPFEAVAGVDALFEALRDPGTDGRGTEGAYRTAIERLQRTVPDSPLSRLVARGYFPSRPKEHVGNDQYRVVAHDGDTDGEHWERAAQALEKLRALLGGDATITQDEVHEAISALVPPLRAVLRPRGVGTWRIERNGPQLAGAGTAAVTTLPAAPAAAQAPWASAPATGTEASAPVPAAVPEADELTPTDGRLNATGGMAAAAIRAMVPGFRAADPDLFSGDDRRTGETLLDEHLPRLVHAFVVADDLSAGAERDQVRTAFAQSLGFVLDGLSGIMARHAEAARQALMTQSRFIEMRHGNDPALSAS